MLDQSIQWIKTPSNLSHNGPYLKARLLRVHNKNTLQFEIQTDRGPIQITSPIDCSFEVSKGKNYEDMCQMDVLNQPEVLSNLVRRYQREQIFTNIGPTLIAINPYHHIQALFGNHILQQYKKMTLEGNIGDSKPHVYRLAGKAFEAIQAQNGKQAIVISGESGAGKTESTKYCVQLLTALGPKEHHSIQDKILAANPVLEAFGNSKTVRNENSSRFGKFMNIYFQREGHIIGATIQSYLLQKSRVVRVSSNQRNFHAFYALTASGQHEIRPAQNYHILRQSHCYKSNHVDDAQYYTQINKALAKIGFTNENINKIWNISACILELGNLDFDETLHLIDQNSPCARKGTQSISRISKTFGIEEQELDKILLFQKRKFLKQYTSIAYGKAACKANQEAFCKALYESLFFYILKGVEAGLRPQEPVQKGKEISILDIFGFQNFTQNSFEQFCINFANERLLRLYNDYVFQKQMAILREDGLGEQILGLVPPSNQPLIQLINGKISLFSIVNDMTLPQFKDEDIMHNFKKLTSSNLLFDKFKPNLFTLVHSPCSVTYSSSGFKTKNQDKLNDEIKLLISNIWGMNQQTSGKTILNKFNKQMNDLMYELESSQVHFMRCIKPNEMKRANFPDQNCILTQIRYLGVLQTIFIRKNTFPHRKTYADFRNLYCIVFKHLYKVGNDQEDVQRALQEVQAQKSQYLLGKLRVYTVDQLDTKLTAKLYQCIKMRQKKASQLQRATRIWLWKIKTLKNLKILSKRIVILKGLPSKLETKILKKSFIIIACYCEQIKQKVAKQQQEARLTMLKQAKQIRQQQKILHKQQIQNASKSDDAESSINTISQSFRVRQGSILPQPGKGPGLSLILNETQLVSQRPIDPRAPYMKPQTPSSALMGQSLTFNSSFMNQIDEQEYQSQVDDSTIAFEGQYDVGEPQPDPKKIQKLIDILSEKYKVVIQGNQQDFFSPISSHCSFKLADMPQTLLSQIMDFPAEQFFNSILRKRTTFFGSAKTYTQILVYKKNVLSKSMTVLSTQTDEKRALQTFKILLKIGQEEDINNVLKYMQVFLEQCQNSSLQLKREIMVQLLRQSTTSYELSAIRVYQTMAVFLHVYNPQQDILKATLHLYYWKLKNKKLGNTEKQYLTYLFSCIVKKISKKTVVGYLPINYQIMGLMCKRQISVPIYLASGSSILINVQSFHSFSDIKQTCLKTFGISQRLTSDLFGFFQVVNFDNEDLEESPIRQTNMIWDMITYWQLTKQKYQEGGITPPNFFLMLKFRYVIAVRQDDEEVLQLTYAQLYFQYYMGRIFLEHHLIFALAALIYKLKYTHKTIVEMAMGLLPITFLQQYRRDEVASCIDVALTEIKSLKLSHKELKFKFIKICALCQLAMSVQIPVQEEYKIFLKPKAIYLIQNMYTKQQKIQSIALKRLIRWQIDKESLTLQFAGKEKGQQNRTYLIKTDCSSIFNELLRSLSALKPNLKKPPQVPSFKKK